MTTVTEPETPQRRPRPTDVRIASALQRIAAILSWALGFALVGIALWVLADVILLVFAAILIACVLHAAAEFVSAKTGLGPGWCLALILIGFTALVGYSGYSRGPTFMQEITQVWQQLKDQVVALWQTLGNASWAQTIAQKAQAYFSQAEGRIAGVATGVATSTLGVIGSLLVVLAAGIYFAVSPQMYVNGTLRLLPRSWRPRGREVLGHLGSTLARWFLGQLIDMIVIGILTGIGLTLLGVKLALTLALIAALLNFIPYIGALAGAVPAILVAFGQGPQTALWVALLFVGIQTFEGNVVAPFIQKRTVDLPPVLTILSQTILGSILGPLGLILASPVTATVMVGVKMVYVETILGDKEK